MIDCYQLFRTGFSITPKRRVSAAIPIALSQLLMEDKMIAGLIIDELKLISIECLQSFFNLGDRIHWRYIFLYYSNDPR
jgi:hypothetical protein